MKPIDLIKVDMLRYKNEITGNSLFSALFIPGFRYTYILRKCAFYKRDSFLGIMYRFLLHFYSVKYGYQINPSTRIGKGLYIGHRGHIIINSKAIIGNFCNIAPGVTIGQANRGNKKGVPVLGDKVWIGTNAVLVGNITIGNDVLIAPNSFLNQDVPSNSIVIGNPAKIIPREHATSEYIENTDI